MNYENKYTDDYFRQHEQEIPVSYDPESWKSVAAMLDAHNGIPAPPPPAPVKIPPALWWACGLLLLSTLFVKLSYQPQEKAPAPVQSVESQPENLNTVSPVDISQPDIQQQSLPAAKSLGKVSEHVPSPSEKPVQPAITPAGADSLKVLPVPVQPDSTTLLKKPVKKKKHLFW